MFMTSTRRPVQAQCTPPEIDWIVDGAVSGAENGRVGVLDIDRGQSALLKPAAAREYAGFVLAGGGTLIDAGREQAIGPEHTILVPSGHALSVRADDQPLKLLLIDTGLAGRGAASTGTKHRAYLVATKDVTLASHHNPKQGFLHVSARWLVNGTLAGSQATIVGQSEFGPEGAHLLHRHDGAAEFFCVLEGEGIHLTEGGGVAMKPGDVVFVPRNEWHGFRNTGSGRVRAAFGYIGANTLDAGGYEVHPSVPQT